MKINRVLVLLLGISASQLAGAPSLAATLAPPLPPAVAPSTIQGSIGSIPRPPSPPPAPPQLPPSGTSSRNGPGTFSPAEAIDVVFQLNIFIRRANVIRADYEGGRWMIENEFASIVTGYEPIALGLTAQARPPFVQSPACAMVKDGVNRISMMAERARMRLSLLDAKLSNDRAQLRADILRLQSRSPLFPIDGGVIMQSAPSASPTNVINERMDRLRRLLASCIYAQ